MLAKTFGGQLGLQEKKRTISSNDTHTHTHTHTQEYGRWGV